MLRPTPEQRLFFDGKDDPKSAVLPTLRSFLFGLQFQTVAVRQTLYWKSPSTCCALSSLASGSQRQHLRSERRPSDTGPTDFGGQQVGVEPDRPRGDQGGQRLTSPGAGELCPLCPGLHPSGDARPGPAARRGWWGTVNPTPRSRRAESPASRGGYVPPHAPPASAGLAKRSGGSPPPCRLPMALGARSTGHPCPLGSPTSTRRAPQAAQPSRGAATHLVPGGSAQAAAPSRQQRGGFPDRRHRCLGSQGKLGLFPKKSKRSEEQRSRCRGEGDGARDGGAIRERQKSLTGRAALFPRPRGAGDRGAHLISLQPLRHGCRALAPSPGSPHTSPQPWLPDKLPPARAGCSTAARFPQLPPLLSS